MEYTVRKIQSEDEIRTCQPFFLKCSKWRNVVCPETYGYMGYVKDKGFYVLMHCEEANPKRECNTYQTNLCQDSVMEVFLAFSEPGKTIRNEDLYLNYEINANGMLYAKYGKGRNNRKFISDAMYRKSNCKVHVEENFWEATVWIPDELLKEVQVYSDVQKKQSFYCNFYKISECTEIEHYQMYSPIENETPNFHLPMYFARAVW